MGEGTDGHMWVNDFEKILELAEPVIFDRLGSSAGSIGSESSNQHDYAVNDFEANQFEYFQNFCFSIHKAYI
jgi:hypothetical protein